MATAASVPSFYKFFFKNLDPLIALYGVYLNFFAQETAVTCAAPQSHYDPDQVFLVFQCGGLSLAFASIMASVHRCTDDLSVWRTVQFGILIADVAALGGLYLSLRTQNRPEPPAWTEDHTGLVGMYSVLAFIRLSFLLKLGFPQVSPRKEKA